MEQEAKIFDFKGSVEQLSKYKHKRVDEVIIETLLEPMYCYAHLAKYQYNKKTERKTSNTLGMIKSFLSPEEYFIKLEYLLSEHKVPDIFKKIEEVFWSKEGCGNHFTLTREWIISNKATGFIEGFDFKFGFSDMDSYRPWE